MEICFQKGKKPKIQVIRKFEKKIMQILQEIIFCIPWQMFGIFMYLVHYGLQAMETHAISWKKVVIVPLPLILLSLKSLWDTLSMHYIFYLSYLASMGIGVILGWLITFRLRIERASEKKSLKISGSNIPLLLILIIFATNYFLEHVMALEPVLGEGFGFRLLRIVTSGIFTGLFVGRTANCLKKAGKSQEILEDKEKFFVK